MTNQTRIFFILVAQDATCTSKRRQQYQLEFPLRKWQTKAIQIFFSSKFTSVWYHPRAKLSFPRFADRRSYLASPCLSFTFKLYHFFHRVHNIQENVPMNNQKSYHFYDYFFFHTRYMLPAIFSRTFSMDQNAFNLKENSSFPLLCVCWFFWEQKVCISFPQDFES